MPDERVNKVVELFASSVLCAGTPLALHGKSQQKEWSL